MEKATSSAHNAYGAGKTGPSLEDPPQHPGQARPAGSAPDPGPATEPATVRARTQPGDAASPPAGGVDIEKVAKNAVASAAAIGSCFGTTSSLNNALRARLGTSVPTKVLAGLGPSISVFPTPWVEDGMRNALGTTATHPVKPSLAHDAVAAASLFAFNLAYSRSAWTPKFAANTPAGFIATVCQTTAASLVAGGASEITAQWMNEEERQKGHSMEHPAHIDNIRKATGRLYSQGAAATLQTWLAFPGNKLSPPMARAPLASVTGGWTFRRALIPPEPSAGSADPPPWVTARAADPVPGFPPHDIPPA